MKVILIIAGIAIAIAAVVYMVNYIKAAKLFIQTDYAKKTGLRFSQVRNDKGLEGEYKLYAHIQDKLSLRGLFLFNTYIPRKANGTSEIDMILLYKGCIFVIENKNYSGDVSGELEDRFWIYQNGRSKRKLYNPFFQNYGHIKAVQEIIGENYKPISVVVFPTFANVDIEDGEKLKLIGKCRYGYLADLGDVGNMIEAITKVEKNRLSIEEEIEVYNKLLKYEGANYKTKLKKKFERRII